MRPFLYNLCIDIYDSPHLIVDTSPLKVVQGSYLFTVDLASLPLSASRDFPSQASAPAQNTKVACRRGQVPAGPDPRSIA